LKDIALLDQNSGDAGKTQIPREAPELLNRLTRYGSANTHILTLAPLALNSLAEVAF
jgi:hypothetical protein